MRQSRQHHETVTNSERTDIKLNQRKDLYDVYSTSLVNWIVQHGFRIIRAGVSTSELHPNMQVFQFRFNQRLKQVVEEYKQNREKLYKVYSLKEANWLIAKGNALIRAEVSDKDETGKLSMFLFEETQKLLEDAKEFQMNNIEEFNGGPRYGEQARECERIATTT